MLRKPHECGCAALAHDYTHGRVFSRSSRAWFADLYIQRTSYLKFSAFGLQTCVYARTQAIAAAACGRGIDMLSVANVALAGARCQGWRPRTAGPA